jgi:hypothetical protein
MVKVKAMFSGPFSQIPYFIYYRLASAEGIDMTVHMADLISALDRTCNAEIIRGILFYWVRFSIAIAKRKLQRRKGWLLLSICGSPYCLEYIRNKHKYMLHNVQMYINCKSYFYWQALIETECSHVREVLLTNKFANCVCYIVSSLFTSFPFVRQFGITNLGSAGVSFDM